MQDTLYEAYKEWRNSMLGFQDDLEWDKKDEATFAVWDAADPEAREDFNLFLSVKTLDHVSFSQMKEMEVHYDSEQ